jgi:hypothetical protein
MEKEAIRLSTHLMVGASRISREGFGLVGAARANEPIRKSARERVGQHDEHRPDDEGRAGIRRADEDTLEEGIEKNTHHQEVRDGLETGPHELAPQVRVEEDAVQIGRPSRSCQATANPEDDRDQGLEDEAESAGAGEPFGNVLEEIA